jgi:hypothetical protein
MKRLALASAALALAILFSAPSFAADASSGPVTCSDGTTSPHGGRGACSKHGGIKKDGAATEAAAAPAKEAKAAKEPKASKESKSDAAAGPVTCSDGTTSKKAGRGACSKHGGIKKDEAAAAPAAAAAPPAPAAKPAAAAPAAAPAAPAAAPAKTGSTAGSGGSVNNDATGATAKCKDGSYSHSKTHTGTCSKHGGVAEWMDGSGKQ